MSSVHSRREFFRFSTRRLVGSVGKVIEDHWPQRPAGPALLRPPGALPEPQFLAACTRCDDCVKACPKWAIRKAGQETGALEGTPIIVPEDQACHWCEDFPCITACTEGALVLNGAAPPPIGTASIDVGACYAWQGQPCDYCLLKCPEKGVAISADERNRPHINRDACVGCGICLDRCPPDAIAIIPAPRASAVA